MKGNYKRKQVILCGKFSEIIKFLKESQKKYIYVSELIDAVNSKKASTKYIN